MNEPVIMKDLIILHGRKYLKLSRIEKYSELIKEIELEFKTPRRKYVLKTLTNVEIFDQKKYNKFLEETKETEAHLQWVENVNDLNALTPPSSSWSDSDKTNPQYNNTMRSECLSDVLGKRNRTIKPTGPKRSNSKQMNDNASNYSSDNDLQENVTNNQDGNSDGIPGDSDEEKSLIRQGGQTVAITPPQQLQEPTEEQKEPILEASRSQESEGKSQEKVEEASQVQNDEIGQNSQQENVNDGRQEQVEVILSEEEVAVLLKDLSDFMKSDQSCERVEAMILTAQEFYEKLVRVLENEQIQGFGKRIDKGDKENLPEFHKRFNEAFEERNIRKILKYLKLAAIWNEIRKTVFSNLNNVTRMACSSCSKIFSDAENTFFIKIKKMNGSDLLLEDFSNFVSQENQKEKLSNDLKFLRQLVNDEEIPVHLKEDFLEAIQTSEHHCQEIIKKGLRRIFLQTFDKNNEFPRSFYKGFMEMYRVIDELEKSLEENNGFIGLKNIMNSLFEELKTTVEKEERESPGQFMAISFFESDIKDFQSVISEIKDLIRRKANVFLL